MRPVHVGCSGWNYAAWRELFYPKGLPTNRWLEHYARHFKTVEVNSTFYATIEPLIEAGRLGPVLWQLPPNMKRDDERLAKALSALPPGRHCFEFREPSWFVHDVYALLREHGVALVIGDRPEVAHFQTREVTTDWTFVRFHHGHRGRRGNYSISELETWKRRVDQWRRTTEVFLYFNNDWEGFAIQNALWMARRYDG
ncbi:MAG: hypothetical protein QOJ22_1219 [Thermoleophilaceae bacterium]|jgi:uncharacterized protein YecE (DUF72 family)|nr:hypothetical protein [Thermoleophilaceae bacterium]